MNVTHRGKINKVLIQPVAIVFKEVRCLNKRKAGLLSPAFLRDYLKHYERARPDT